MHVVVVESPAKAKTIGRYLGDGYRVFASYGHVSDLPAKDGSVRPEDGFAMTYVTARRANRVLSGIRAALKDAESLILATDPDREGEAIAWQVLTWLQEKDAIGERPVRRVDFHEITEHGVRDAMAHPRDLDMDLVRAQQARRALDYLVGFHLSAVLWRKVPGSRSAGRVQSVALRLVCEREAEIESFVPQEYWTVDVQLEAAGGGSFTARPVFALYVVLILVMGTVLDSTSIMLVVLPLVLPIAQSFGVDLVWFGIVTVIAVEIGLLTPPLGIAVYVIKSTLDDPSVRLGDIFAGAAPFAAIMLVVLLLIILFPWLSLALL